MGGAHPLELLVTVGVGLRAPRKLPHHAACHMELGHGVIEATLLLKHDTEVVVAQHEPLWTDRALAAVREGNGILEALLHTHMHPE